MERSGSPSPKHYGEAMVRRRSADVNLDALFRPGSAARKIAERLMTGKPQTRYELVEGQGLGTSVTTVNRVVAHLEKAGAIITGEIASDGRQAVFRLVEVTSPKGGRPYLHMGDRVRVVAAPNPFGGRHADRRNGGQVHLPRRAPWRGHEREHQVDLAPTVEAIQRVDGTLSNVRFEAHGTTSGERVVVLESVRILTEA